MHATLISLLESYGYVVLFLLVALESLGIPLPGETALVTAAAFAAAGVHIVGRRRWNRRGARVTDRYLQGHHHGSVTELGEFARAIGNVARRGAKTPRGEPGQTCWPS